MPLADVLAGRPAISTPALAGRVMIPRPGRSPLDRPCAHMRLSDDPATRAEPPPRRGGADEERGGDRFAAPSVRPTRTSAPAPARGPARSRRRVGPRHRVRNHRPEGRGHGDEAGDNSARGSLAEGRGHGDEPRPGEPRCTGATSDHPPPRPARLLRPFRSATPLHPSLYEEKGRSRAKGAQQRVKGRSRRRPAEPGPGRRPSPARSGPVSMMVLRRWRPPGPAPIRRCVGAAEKGGRRVSFGCAAAPTHPGNGVIAPLRDGRGAGWGVKDMRRPPFGSPDRPPAGSPAPVVRRVMQVGRTGQAGWTERAGWTGWAGVPAR